jgi:CRP-like cAMP-binding protein
VSTAFNRTSLLSSVPILAGVPERALDELALGAEARNFAPGDRLVSELEPGEEALIILEGVGRVTVGGLGNEPPVEIGEVSSGDCVGEMALFTNELRSATVTAKTPVRALVLDRPTFNGLLRRHPSMAAHLAGVLGTRLRDTETVLAEVLDPSRSDEERRNALKTSAPKSSQRKFVTALRIAWQELVAERKRELPFLLLVSFVASLLAIRGLVRLERATMPEFVSLHAILRMSYIAGLFVLCAAGTGALLFFRPATRRWIAMLFGVGMAFLFNALPVLLTFDLFYKDIFTPDPTLQFSVETLYSRTDGANIVILTLAVLGMAVYLRRFFRRLLTLVQLRVQQRRA